jgi:hypothetical protein
MQMRITLLALLLFAGTSTADSSKSSGEQCLSLQVCLQELLFMAKHSEEHSPQAVSNRMAIIDRLNSFDGAVARLVPLLADPDEDIANAAAEALRDAK